MKKTIKIPVMVLAIIGVLAILIILLSVIYGKLENIRYEKEYEEDYNEIEFKVPEKYENRNYYSYYYDEDGVRCTLYLNAYGRYEEDFEKWFKGNIQVSLNDEVGELQEIETNGNKGYLIKTKEKYYDKSYYGFVSTNHYYILEFSSNKVDDNEDIGVSTCYNLENEVIASIKLK